MNNTRMLPVLLLSSLAISVGCAATSSSDSADVESSALTADDSIAGAWMASAGDVRALVLSPGDSRSDLAPRAFTALVSPKSVVGTWTLDGDVLRLTPIPNGPRPESADDAAHANAMRKVFGEHRVRKQGNRLELVGGPLAASLTYAGTTYCDDLFESQCRYQTPHCEGRNEPRRPGPFKSMPHITSRCLVDEHRCDSVCMTSYRDAQVDGKEFLVTAGDVLQIPGQTERSRALPRESWEWKSESPSVTVHTASESLETYALGTYDLKYRFLLDKAATPGSVHRVKHVSSPWSFTIRVR